MNRRHPRPRVHPGQRTGQDVATGLAALVALIALVVGLPLLLSVVAPLHLPTQVPTVEQVRDTLWGPDDGTVFLGFLTVIAWAGWAWLAVAVIVEITAAIRGLPARRHPGLSLAQPVAASLVTAVMLLLTTPASQADVPAPAAQAVATALHEVPVAFTAPVADPAPGAAPGAGQGPSARVTTSPGNPGASPPAVPQSSGPVLEVTVRRGDTLWSLAETHLGDGIRYREIAQANYGRPQSDGRSLTEAHWIYPGWVLRIPGATAREEFGASRTHTSASDEPPPEGSGASGTTTYVVQPGDTLWDIAEDHLGEGFRYPRIARASRDIVQDDGARLGDPDLIRPDWHLNIPGDHTGSGQDPTRERPEHHDAQEHQDPQAPQQPSPTPSPPGPSGQPHATSPAGVPVPPVTPSAPAPTAVSATAPPTPVGSTPGSPAATATSAPARSPTGTMEATALPQEGPSASAVPDAGDPRRPDAEVGVRVPGGWMDYPLAAALVSLIALVWAWRRHRHTYTPADLLTPPGQGDEDLAELPTVFTRSRSVVRAYAPGLLEPEDPGPTVAEYYAAQRARAAAGDDADEPQWVPEPPGPDGLVLAGLGDHYDGGIGLVGPGATDAARALIVAAVASGGHFDCYAWTDLVIPAALATRLLTPTPAHEQDSEPAGPAVLQGLERVELVGDLSAALEHVERETSTRLRLLNAYHVADRQALHEFQPIGEPMPLLVLLTEAPPQDLRERLAAVATRGAPVGIRVVVVGEWAAGTTADIDADGYLSGVGPGQPSADRRDAPGQDDQREHHRGGDHDGERRGNGPSPPGTRARVAVLDVDAAVDAVAVVREAYTGAPAPAQPRGSGPDIARADLAADPSTTQASTVPAASTVSGDTHPGSEHVAGAPADADPTSGVRVRVRVLGEPVILDAQGRPVTGLRSAAVELLVLLAVRRSGGAMDDLMDALWPTALRSTAPQRLFTEVSRLRRAIRQVAGDRDVQGVVKTAERYWLDPAVVEVDLWEVIDLLRRIGATTDRQVAIDGLRRVLALTDGRILAQGRDYEWIGPARERLRRSLLRAHLRLSELLTGAGDHTGAAQVAMAAVELDLTNEDTVRAAMRALAAAGRHAEIPTLLRRAHTALQDLDIDLSEETTALAQRLRRDPPPTGLRAV